MPRFIEKHKTQKPLAVDPTRLHAFTSWLAQEIAEDTMFKDKTIAGFIQDGGYLDE